MAVWALSRSGVPFEENGYAPGQHIPPVLALRVGNKQNTRFVSDSSRVTRVGGGTVDLQSEEGRKKDAESRQTAVPVAVTPEGAVLLDSWAILKHTGLPEMDEELRNQLDFVVGPLTRQCAYSYLLKTSNLNIFDELCTEGRSWMWGLAWDMAAKKVTVERMSDVFQPNNPEAVAEARGKLQEVTEALGKRIEARETKFLCGDTLGLADIALAALYAPVLLAPQYCAGKYKHIFDKLRQQDPEVNSEIEYWQSTVVGKYALLIYLNYRLN